MRKGFTLSEIVAVFIVICVLGSLLLPLHEASVRRARVVSCANNLSQLWKLESVYMCQFGCRGRSMPKVTGLAFWHALTTTDPQLVEPADGDIFR